VLQGRSDVAVQVAGHRDALSQTASFLTTDQDETPLGARRTCKTSPKPQDQLTASLYGLRGLTSSCSSAEAGKAVRMVGTAIGRSAAVTLAAAMVLGACAGGDSDRAPDGGPTPRADGLTIEVTETEYALSASPRDGLIPAPYTFVVQNHGKETHALAISGPGVDGQTELIRGGAEPAKLAVSLRPGRYELWCPVGDHRDRGMETSLLVEVEAL